jgi:acetyltransferase
MKNLDKIFKPKTIAVIGASDNEGSVGHALMKNLIGSDYDGTVYPVNNKRKNVQSIKAYKSIKDISDKIDLVIIAIPAIFVLEVVKECGQAGVGGIVIISAGFQEIGKKGEEMSQEILKVSRQYNMRIIGPNCLGFIRPALHLNASFSGKMALPGKIALISQSGALCTSILDWSIKNNVGFSHFVSIGSMLDVGFADLIDYFGQDKETESILIYMETLSEARKFMSAARAFSRTKPIIVLKAGQSTEGAKAAKSHTGSLAGDDMIFNAAFERAGIIRVETVVDLFHVAKTLAMQKRPINKHLAIVTNAGGPGVLAVDALIRSHGKLADLNKKTINSLDKFLPSAWSHSNPVDIIGDADPLRYSRAVSEVIKDDEVGAVLVILTPQAMTDPIAVAHKIVALSKNNKTGKPILASWMGGFDVEKGREILEKGNVPIYRSPEDAIKTFAYINSYTNNLSFLYETPATIPHAFTPNIEANRAIIDKIIKEKREILNEAEAKEILSNYGIAVVKNAVAMKSEEAGLLAEQIGFPVVMKILSTEILHKTDVGGVKLNIKSKAEAEAAFKSIADSVKKNCPQVKWEGIFIEAMAKKRYELLIGSKKDPIFGPVILFGMGGIAVEVFKDTKAGLPPLNMSLAMRLVRETKIYKLLRGYRNIPGVDIQAIQFLLYKFAYLVADFPEIKEVDINPFAIDEHGGMVLDAKIILDKKLFGKDIKPYSHLVISPYPKEYLDEFKLKNGKKVLLRPIKPEDEEMEGGLFKTFSQESLKQRFFEVIKKVDHDLLTRFTQIDYDREMAIAAIVKEDGKEKIIGVVRMITDPTGEAADFTIGIGDPWHFQSLGKKFTDYILEIAKSKGVKVMRAKYYSSNKPMHSILVKKGFKITTQGKFKLAELDLK